MNTERQNNLYGVNRKTMTISNAHYMFIFSPQTAISFWSLPLCLSHFLPNQEISLAHSLARSLFIATEIHSTCPLIGVPLFLYLCIPLFIQNHMLMKSVIINLKYLIFRSVSASEGGWLEEQRRREGGGGRGGAAGGGGGKSYAVASALSASATFKSAPTKAQVRHCFPHLLHLKSSYELQFLNPPPKDSRPKLPLLSGFFFLGEGDVSRFGLQYRSLPLSPISKLHPQPQH